jgi:hypothetical protein
LQVGVVAAHVELAIRIVGHARRLQQHLVDRRVVALRQGLDVLLRETVDACADVWLQAVTGHVETLSLYVDIDRAAFFERDLQRMGRGAVDGSDAGIGAKPLRADRDRIGTRPVCVCASVWPSASWRETAAFSTACPWVSVTVPVTGAPVDAARTCKETVCANSSNVAREMSV